MVIVKKGNKWQLRSKDGKKLLGVHDTRKSAEKQERAVQANKRRAR